MTQNQAVVAVMKAFPGTRPIYTLVAAPHGVLRQCVKCGLSTVLRDLAGTPWHEGCRNPT